MSGFGRGSYHGARRLDRAARLVALAAVILQLFAPFIALRSFPSAAAKDLGALFDAGLICHGAGNDQRPEPNGPAGPHADHAVCCVFHGNAGPLLPTPIAVVPVGFFYFSSAFTASAPVFVAARPQGAAHARDPPTNT